MTKKATINFLWNKSPKGRLEFWKADNGRWYWHLVSRGRIKDDGSYASRRSCRRALRTMFGPPIEETQGV